MLTPIQSIPTRRLVQRSSLLWRWGNIYSQTGQDGILTEIFSRLNLSVGTFAEFGAWDGVYLSNCRLLFEKGWSGIFIEADGEKFKVLQANYENEANICCIDEFVSAANPLDRIVTTRSPFSRLDFVSIDVDGPDLDIAMSSNLYELGVKVVLMEGGSNFDPRLSKRVPTGPMQQPLTVIINEMKSVGYEAVCFFQDTFFVRRDLADQFSDINRDATSLYLDAFNFMGDRYKEIVMSARQGFSAGKIEAQESIEFLRGC